MIDAERPEWCIKGLDLVKPLLEDWFILKVTYQSAESVEEMNKSSELLDTVNDRIRQIVNLTSDYRVRTNSPE